MCSKNESQGTTWKDQPYGSIRVEGRCHRHGDVLFRPTSDQQHVFERLICERCQDEAIASLGTGTLVDTCTVPFSYEMYMIGDPIVPRWDPPNE